MKKYAFLLCLFTACEGIIVKDLEQAIVSTKQRQGRLQLSSSAIRSLFRASTPDGVLIDSEASIIVLEGNKVQMGPLNEKLSIHTQQVDMQSGELEVSIEMRSIVFPLAIRVGGIEPIICRRQISFAKVKIDARMKILSDNMAPRLRVSDVPNIMLEGVNVFPIGKCSLPFDESLLNEEIKKYLKDAFRSAAISLFETSPTDLLGVSTGGSEISKPRHEGALLVGRTLSPGARITAEDISIELDFALQTRRDKCVPPLKFDVSKKEIGERISTQSQLMYSVSKSFIRDFLGASTISGLFCTQGDAILNNDIQLSELGLAHIPVESDMKVEFQPASLPETRFSEEGLIHIKWPRVTIDSYAKVFGISQRIVWVDIALDIELRPNIHENKIHFDIESMQVRTNKVRTKWTKGLQASPEVNAWVQRILLLAFEAHLQIPSPLQTSIPLKLETIQMTKDDFLLSYSID